MGWMGPAISAGIGAIGGALGGGGQEHIGPGDAVPKWMREQLKGLYNQVFDLQTPEYYGGELIAGRTPGYEQALEQAYGFGTPGGAGYDASQALLGAGYAGLPGIGQGMDYLSQMQSAGPREFQFDQGTFDTTMANLMPGVQGSFDAMMRDPTRQLTENILPGFSLGGSLSNTQWGTSPQNQSAIAMRGFNDLAADTYSGLYQNALNQAQQAGYGAGTQNLASGQGLDRNLLQGYGAFGGQGMQALGRGFDLGAQGIGMGQQAGVADLGYAQSLIDAEMAKWNFGQNAPWTALQTQMGMLPRYGNAMGAQLPPGFGQGGQSGFANALQGAQAGLGIYGMGQDAGWWGGGGGGGDTTYDMDWWNKSYRGG